MQSCVHAYTNMIQIPISPPEEQISISAQSNFNNKLPRLKCMPFKDLQVSLILCDNIHDPFKPEQKLSEHVELAQFAIGSSKPDMK